MKIELPTAYASVRLLFHPPETPAEWEPICAHITNCYQHLAKVCRQIAPATLVLAGEKQQLIVPLRNGVLAYIRTNPATVNAYVDSIILIDVPRTLSYPEAFRREAAILEELCHVHLGITDETLVSQVVALIHPEIGWNGESYFRKVP